MSLRPWYNKDANYQTNAKSFMDYLGRTNHFLEVLIEDYDNFQELVIEELERIKFNAEMTVEDILLNWLDDGTLERIINDEVFGNKADTDWVENQLNQLREDIQNELNETIGHVNTSLSNMDTKLTNDFSDFSSDINTNIQTFKSDVNNQINDLSKSIPINHVYSDKYDTLQQAFNAAENGVLHIKKGTYQMTTPLKIKSNTTVYAYGSTFRRNANINNLFINDSDGTQGVYNANENIEIHGAVFDGAGGTFSDKCTLLAFGHAKNIKIMDSTFKNLRDWHMVELNACQNVLIQNCLFEDYGTSIMGTEMVQIDVARSTTEFPWFGPYDETTCDNIVIKNNKFVNGVRAIGTHTSVNDKEHTRITISENEFQNMSGEAVYGLDWAFTKIHENHFYDVWKAVHLRVEGRTVNNHSIIGNYMSGLANDSHSRGIQISGLSDGYSIHGGTIKNNKVKRFGSHGIGVDFSDKWVIEGNECQHNGLNGIIIWGASYLTVTGNVSLDNNLSDTERHDLHISQSTYHVTVSGNTFNSLYCDESPRYIFVTSNSIMDSYDFASSGTRVMVNNFVNGAVEP